MRRVLTLALPLLIVLALAVWRAQGPAPRDASAPETAFSATRAMTALRAVIPDATPHPVGSPANVRVRERLESRFRALGYETSVQRRFACKAGGTCATIENVIARAPGRASGDLVLLVAHYDSVPAGPGASDDGMGIATMLEVARAIRKDALSNRVAFLATDGEEAGLLGAEAFVAEETLSRDVAALINMEMRGTRGTSNMFETSSGNRWLIRHLANALERPAASSFAYAVYTLLPNDTDVTVFKRAGKAAVNFAGIGGANWYHTPFDDLGHLSLRTLQHHGDNALATLRVLGDADLAARSHTDAVFFDVLGFFILWWPQEWTLWIAAISLLLLVFAARKTSPRAMTFGVLAMFGAILFSALGGMAMAWVLRLRGGDANWVAHPLASILTMALLGITAALLAAALFNRRNDARAMAYGGAIVWHMIGIALAVALPGAAYLLIVPAVAVTICALARVDETITSAVSATVAAILYFPILLLLYDALGSNLIVAIAVVSGVFATLLAPLFARARHALAAFALVVVCAIAALLQPAYTAEKPQFIQLHYIDDGSGARWTTWDLTDSLRKAAPFASVDASQSMPWNRGTIWTAPAPDLRLPRVLVSGERTAEGVIVRVKSQRSAGRISLFYRGAELRRINGVVPPQQQHRQARRLPGDWRGASAAGVQELVVELAGKGAVEVVASDVTFALPPEGAPLQRARDASPGITIQDGDVTVTRTRATF